MVLDMSVRRQIYVEDCEVCCRPIQIRYTVVNNDIAEFNARSVSETPRIRGQTPNKFARGTFRHPEGHSRELLGVCPRISRFFLRDSKC
jgi:hypothetical protein